MGDGCWYDLSQLKNPDSSSSPIANCGSFELDALLLERSESFENLRASRSCLVCGKSVRGTSLDGSGGASGVFMSSTNVCARMVKESMLNMGLRGDGHCKVTCRTSRMWIAVNGGRMWLGGNGSGCGGEVRCGRLEGGIFMGWVWKWPRGRCGGADEG